MKNVVGLKEFRQNMEVYIKHVKNGHSFVVFRRSEPVFVVSPVPKDFWDTIKIPKNKA